MANTPFGGFGPFPGTGSGGDSAHWQRGFESLARQYSNAWGKALRAAGGASASAPTGIPDWQDAVEWWSRLAHGGRSETNDAVERFNAQARHWFGQMQRVAAQFVGQEHSAAQIADAWKQALGATADNPFLEIFRAMHGHHLQGLDQWIEVASPWLEAMRREGMSWLSLPAFGIGREHQQRLQALARAQIDCQDKSSAYNALMAKSGERAFELFEDKLAERSEPGRQLSSVRALFDLWIDAAEEAYAEIALAPEFGKAYGELVDAQMRLRAGVQHEVELACGLFGMPTRGEMDASHRKVAELERQLWRMQRSAGGSGDRGLRAGTTATAKPAAKPASRPASKVAKRPARATSGEARKLAPPVLFDDIAAPQAPAAAGRAAQSRGAHRRGARR